MITITFSDLTLSSADKDIQRNIPFTPSEATAKHERLLTSPNEKQKGPFWPKEA